MRIERSSPALTLALTLCLIGFPLTGSAQEPPPCADGRAPRADLGISSLGCACSVKVDADGLEKHWRFNGEPEVLAITPGSAADGRLRPGDRIVAIDGRPITTTAGGERWSTLEPGQKIRLKVRRQEAVIAVDLVVGQRCLGDASQPAPSPSQGPAPLPRLLPRGWLGAGLSCRCSVSTEGGAPLWAFEEAPRIEGLTPGGPAVRAGLQQGDTLLEIDGLPLTSDAGAAVFSALEPGQRIRLAFSRDGVEQVVELVAEKRPAPETPAAP